ncbi:MAG: hypothetical protein WC624_05430 [Candidatus Margulisiibacteriota bacterium]
MQQVIIRNVTVPTMEIIAKTGSIQLWMPIIAALFSTFMGAILAVGVYWWTQIRPQQKAIKIAIKYEIYRNFYQMIDLGYCSKCLLDIYVNSAKIGVKAGGKLIYCKPHYIVFEAMIKNGLVAAFNNREDALFSLYEAIREYDSTLKDFVSDVNDPEKGQRISQVLESIIRLAEQIENKLDGYFDKLDFLNKDEWGKFREENKNIWERKRE